MTASFYTSMPQQRRYTTSIYGSSAAGRRALSERLTILHGLPTSDGRGSNSLFHYSVPGHINAARACWKALRSNDFNSAHHLDSRIVCVVCKNCQRRLLMIGQPAAIGAEMMPILKEEARKRQSICRALDGRSNGEVSPISTEPHAERAPGETRTIAGREGWG